MYCLLIKRAIYTLFYRLWYYVNIENILIISATGESRGDVYGA